MSVKVSLCVIDSIHLISATESLTFQLNCCISHDSLDLCDRVAVVALTCLPDHKASGFFAPHSKTKKEKERH